MRVKTYTAPEFAMELSAWLPLMPGGAAVLVRRGNGERIAVGAQRDGEPELVVRSPDSRP